MLLIDFCLCGGAFKTRDITSPLVVGSSHTAVTGPNRASVTNFMATNVARAPLLIRTWTTCGDVLMGHTHARRHACGASEGVDGDNRHHDGNAPQMRHVTPPFGYPPTIARNWRTGPKGTGRNSRAQR